MVRGRGQTSEGMIQVNGPRKGQQGSRGLGSAKKSHHVEGDCEGV
jgi:hypothetical protein